MGTNGFNIRENFGPNPLEASVTISSPMTYEEWRIYAENIDKHYILVVNHGYLHQKITPFGKSEKLNKKNFAVVEFGEEEKIYSRMREKAREIVAERSKRNISRQREPIM